MNFHTATQTEDIPETGVIFIRSHAKKPVAKVAAPSLCFAWVARRHPVAKLTQVPFE